MKNIYDSIFGAVNGIQNDDEKDYSHRDLYQEIKDGLKTPTYTKRIGDEMKLEETEFEGTKKFYVITKITTIDYTKFQLESRLKPKK